MAHTRGSVLCLLLVVVKVVSAQNGECPAPEAVLPCICTNRHEDFQIWCTHSDMTQVVKGFKSIGNIIEKPIDELIIENNYLPSLPGKVFQNVKVLRLMLRHNGLERLSAAWLETQEPYLIEIFIVESELRGLPSESLMKLHNLQAITVQSHNLKRIPVFANMQKIRYINIQSRNLNLINENTFENLPNLEKIFIQGSPNLRVIKENALYNLPKLKKLEITHCGVHVIHMRAFSLMPLLSELSLNNNKISDATMVGRATKDLSMLSYLNLDSNSIDKLNEGAFVDQPMLEKIYLSNNNISIIQHGAFHRVPRLRIVDLNYNKIRQIHPESFLQHSASGVEELNFIGNEIMHISEFRALLDALPRLTFLDLSDNLLQDIPRGALRGHPSLERLHLNKNNIKYIQADSFVAMPALRELHLSNNSLSELGEGPFWNLPTLKGLDLSYNYFQRLQPKLLHNLPALRRMDLSYNQLTIIDPITFMNTPLLEYVNVSGNNLVSIHPATFRNLENLYEIDVSSNRLIEFIPGLPKGLEKLYLQKNQITSLPISPSPDLDLPSLRTLDLSSNGLQKIPYGTTKTLHNLRRFYIKRNGLRQIEATTFSELEHLEILDLSDNQILMVHPKSFAKLAKLKQVNLHGNSVESFDLTKIHDNEEMLALDLSKNRLKSLSSDALIKTLNVETLNMSSNNLNVFPTALNIFSRLKILDASFNHIKNLDVNSINNLHTLIDIKMPSNKLIELRPRSFKDLRNLETIDLDNNHIEIIHPEAFTNLPNLLSIHLSRNHIIDIPDRAFVNLQKLRIIELQGNRLQFISIRAFENMPLAQYMNLSNNQLSNVDNSGLKQLASLEVLDLSFNKITKLTKSSFEYMEWLIELNLDNNWICFIDGQPFDSMPRLKVLSLRHNKLKTISEVTFEKLRSNIAILDIDGNPLACNCAIIWLKLWLLESSSIGPKCSDGTYVKQMKFSRNDCFKTTSNEKEFSSCVTYENESLLPNLATSQVFSSLDKIKDFSTQIKNNYHSNKINRPLPEESDYFYDEYVDYPYNATLIDGFNNQINLPLHNKTHGIGNTPTLYAEMKNKTNPNISLKAPTSGFTFFGMPLPAIDMGKILNTGRKLDWPVNKSSLNNRYQTPPPPKFETGGFKPMLPSTAGGFIPIPDPSFNITQTEKLFSSHSSPSYYKGFLEQSTKRAEIKPTIKTSQNNVTHQNLKSEIHELQAFMNDNNKTQIAYNRMKNVEEKIAPDNLSKYNFMESNLTTTEITEKEVLLITTDTANDVSMQAWMESSTISYSTSNVDSPKPVKKLEEQPTALSAVLIPKSEESVKNYIKRPATITKVAIPHPEQHEIRNVYSPVNNREAKTRFSDITSSSNTKTWQVEGKEWYYKNYNNSNLEPYIAPGVHASMGSNIYTNINVVIMVLGYTLTLLIL